MPRAISLQGLQAMLAQQTSEVMLELLVIDHADMASPLRFVNNSESIVSGGNTYEPWPFKAVLPTDDPEQEPRASIQISNIDLSVTIALDQLASRPTVTLGVVTLTDPDTYEYGPMTFDVADERGDAKTITLDLAFQDLDQEPFPGMSFTPQLFPALF